MRQYNKISFAAQILYALTLGCAKLSILFMLQSIFSLASQAFRNISYMVMILVICWMLQTVLVPFLICHPVAKSWDASLPGYCGDSVSFSISALAVLLQHARLHVRY